MSKLLEALQEVTEADLAEIDAQIQSLEAELAGLKAARSVVAARLGVATGRGKAARKKPDGGAAYAGQSDAKAKDVQTDVDDGTDSHGAPTLTGQRREAIYKYLTSHGATRQVVLMRELGIPQGSMGALVKHIWFQVLEDGRVDIARTGGRR